MTAQLSRPVGPGEGIDRTSLIGAAVGTAALVGFVATANDDDGFVVCLFRRCTGGYCPGCGATRAARRLAVGDVGGAWSHHPWVVFAAVQAVIVGAVLAMTERGARRARLLSMRSWLVAANVALMVGIYAVRLVDGSIPRPF